MVGAHSLVLNTSIKLCIYNVIIIVKHQVLYVNFKVVVCTLNFEIVHLARLHINK